MAKQVDPAELRRRADVLSAAMAAASPPWTVTALASAAGVDHGHVSRILAGKVSGSAAVLASLADVLRISMDDLVQPRRPVSSTNAAPNLVSTTAPPSAALTEEPSAV